MIERIKGNRLLFVIIIGITLASSIMLIYGVVEYNLTEAPPGTIDPGFAGPAFYIKMHQDLGTKFISIGVLGFLIDSILLVFGVRKRAS